jgi:hypothetical protein
MLKLLDIFIEFMIFMDIFIVSEKVKAVVQWDEATNEEWANGIRIVLNHFKEIKQVNYQFLRLYSIILFNKHTNT